ncbi:hypothetical protein KDW_38870 [Dictyobacter vulcani]|uniref:tRNA-guanine(15) transglycosylase-like domain-containing protein n=1 Tax=Dictyobacter vulcani TaxID=2607529 RepID=A0A5J4KPC0_9CHLR|nr:DUF5591 domain-containing protein [Dictyobacter vulcani]GER89725.1 hypothetical protein KDW_38870 [Dictyobacter vulcani]
MKNFQSAKTQKDSQPIPEILQGHCSSKGFITQMHSSDTNLRARCGLLTVHDAKLETPALFPVINLLTGPPSLERNGATHKFLKRQLIFNDRRVGFMTEVLHFTDYAFSKRMFQEWFPHAGNKSGEVKDLDYWVKESFESLKKPAEVYRPMFFLDSGGFRLLFNREADITDYGYKPDQKSIFQLQIDYGADIVASLDYPIPPFLNKQQAEDRIKCSVENAVLLMKLIYSSGEPLRKRPFPILAVHGQTPVQIRSCVLQLLHSLAKEGFTDKEPFGIGIGSLVPLRMSSNADKIVMIVKSAIDTLYDSSLHDFKPERVLVHAFGITGNLIPILTHLGVDTFDSSSYVKSASSLNYYDSKTWSVQDFLKLTQITCTCKACNGITDEELMQMQADLRGNKINGHAERLQHKAGDFIVDIKSDIYGIIAYHNLLIQYDEIREVRDAISRGQTAQHLVHFCKTHTKSIELAELVAEIDPTVKALLNYQPKLFPRTREDYEQHREISLANDPMLFDIAAIENYQVPSDKDRLFLLACSQEKPYSHSKIHQGIFRTLKHYLGDALNTCHKVTISGLYGPVPFEYENEQVVLSYEYLLSVAAKKQADLITKRLVTYLEENIPEYKLVVAYVAAKAYRAIVENAFKQVKLNYAQQYGNDAPFPVPLIVLPSKTKGTGTKELLIHANLEELVHQIFPEREIYMNVPGQLKNQELF